MPHRAAHAPNRDLYELAVRIGGSWRAIRRGAAWVGLRDYLYGTGSDALDQGQMDTLDLLAQQDSWRMSDLAEQLRVEPSTATRAVQRLEKDGLATRQPSADDGRVVEVSVTSAGRARHRDVANRRTVLMTHILSTYSADELPQLADMLERFVASIDEFVAEQPSPATE
jgi:DNA-binding MarR family transcriptional regulator